MESRCVIVLNNEGVRAVTEKEQFNNLIVVPCDHLYYLTVDWHGIEPKMLAQGYNHRFFVLMITKHMWLFSSNQV